MRVAIVIPARMGSSRFPGKPLAKIHEKSMLGHVIENARSAKLAQAVYVATCDDEIRTEANSFDVPTVMTSNSHVRASDRVAEAAEMLASKGEQFDLFVMLQGDEPCISGQVLDDQIAWCRDHPEIGVSNLVGAITSREEHFNPNTIKCLLAADRMIYLSRLPVPGSGHLDSGILGKQICSIAFSRESLRTFSELAPGGLEEAESIDMLRFIENGLPVGYLWTELRSHPVDVPSDIAVVERILSRVSEPGL